MQRRQFLLTAMSLALFTRPAGAQPVGAGLREALRVGTERVVGRIGRTDGYFKDPEIKIPLPPALERAGQALALIGQSGLAEDLELRLNRAAEAAAPQAKSIFWQAIADMTLEDADRILRGPDDSATRYFQGRMSKPLALAMQPIVETELAQAGAVQSYDAFIGRYRTLPFVPDAKADLTQYVLEKGMDGIFHYLAKEEAAIRRNPAARTTDLLRSVFGL